MAATKKSATESIDILEITTGSFTCNILGITPLILNRMSQKVLNELLLPRGKKTAAEKASTLKHVPIEEYRASPYVDSNPSAQTRLLMPATAFKGALRSVATDMPGAAKAQIGRLTYVAGEYISIFGVPQIFCSVTRSADMNRTPDVRTRAIVPQWACTITVSFVKPLLREQPVVNLLAAAGIMRGVGDWRPEKGAGTFGQFELVSSEDERFLKVVKEGGRVAQDAALETPEAYDRETEELLSWYDVEVARRGFKVVA